MSKDGNCLFRSLADQLDGSPAEHARHRQEVVSYIRNHWSYFKLFESNEVDFDDFLFDLAGRGNFAGNESIVAFARLHNIDVIIHQLGKVPWTINGGPENTSGTKTLHLSYHNGNHYNSVRPLGDTGDDPPNHSDDGGGADNVSLMKVDREEPAMSMDSGGNIIWANHRELQQASLKTLDKGEIQVNSNLYLISTSLS